MNEQNTAKAFSVDDLWPNDPEWSLPGWCVTAVGSRATCCPPPIDTDADYLCMVTKSDAAIAHLEALGFTSEGSPEFYTGNDNGGFRSLRRGDVNAIVTDDWVFGEKFLTASSLAKRFNLLRKADRIALFQAVLYGVKYDLCEARHD